jgi:hypothetical protein
MRACCGIFAAMLKLRIARGPLQDAENHAILYEYNRLTGSQIPLDEFVNWVQKSPAGPAWHALLTTDEDRIVGHTSLFPFTTLYSSERLTPAKSEYSFLHEDFRKEKITGYEKAARATFVVMLDELFRHGQREGWGPIFASTNEKNQAFTRRIGLQPAEYNVWECLFILRPVNASRHTPNLTPKQRAALVAAGISQRVVWTAAQVAFRGQNGVHHVPIKNDILEPERLRISFFEDAPSLEWRYLHGQYVRLSVKASPGSYVIAKKGGPDRYLRVCQWRLEREVSARPLIAALLREARPEKALGVRWALYEKDAVSLEILKRLRRMGFVCAQRIRTVMVHKKDPQFLSPSAWKMNDSLFSFDP